jgi:hypothetical protein
LLRWLLAGLGVGLMAAGAAAQETSVAAALQSLNARAGVVFSGQVTRIEKHAGVVDVWFHVDRAVKGGVGATYDLREWGGLWAAGQQRYWVGERAMVFLRPAAAGSGFSSPVDGMDGVLPQAKSAGFDVSRLRTRLLRAVGAPLPGSGNAMSLNEIVQTLAPPRPAVSLIARVADAR